MKNNPSADGCGVVRGAVLVVVDDDDGVHSDLCVNSATQPKHNQPAHRRLTKIKLLRQLQIGKLSKSFYPSTWCE